MHISASSGLHCPLLTNSSCGTEMLQGTDVLGVETSSPPPRLMDHPRQSQLEGLPWAGLPLPASSVAFSAVAGRAVGKGELPALEEPVLPHCPSSCPPPGLVLQPLGRTREWQRQGSLSDAGRYKCPANKAKVPLSQ